MSEEGSCWKSFVLFPQLIWRHTKMKKLDWRILSFWKCLAPEVSSVIFIAPIVYSSFVNLRSSEDFRNVFFPTAYGKVFLVRKRGGYFSGNLYAMKVLKKATIVQKAKTAEHTRTERQVLEAVRRCPFLVTLHWAFQTESKLHLIMGLFTICYFVILFSFNTIRA